MSISHLLLIYVALALGALSLVGIFSELRRRRFGPTHPEDRVFRCTKCGLVYTDVRQTQHAGGILTPCDAVVNSRDTGWAGCARDCGSAKNTVGSGPLTSYQNHRLH
jgi:hypothetical protein